MEWPIISISSRSTEERPVALCDPGRVWDQSPNLGTSPDHDYAFGVFRVNGLENRISGREICDRGQLWVKSTPYSLMALKSSRACLVPCHNRQLIFRLVPHCHAGPAQPADRGLHGTTRSLQKPFWAESYVRCKTTFPCKIPFRRRTSHTTSTLLLRGLKCIKYDVRRCEPVF
jgi:hypothetical protein